MEYSYSGLGVGGIHHEPGEVVLAWVSDKLRPVIVVSPGTFAHNVIPITTQSLGVRSHDNFNAPIWIPCLKCNPSFVSSRGVQDVDRVYLDHHLGWINEDTLLTITSYFDLSTKDRNDLTLSVFNRLPR